MVGTCPNGNTPRCVNMPLKEQDGSPHNWIGLQRKKKAEVCQDLHPGERAEGEERLLHLRKSPHHQGDELRQERSFRCLGETKTGRLWQPRQNETYIEGLCNCLGTED